MTEDDDPNEQGGPTFLDRLMALALMDDCWSCAYGPLEHWIGSSPRNSSLGYSQDVVPDLVAKKEPPGRD